ncbi:MAG: hypothetical protein RMJ83_10240 [Armatimonadota bacterium]|nr:hypothetical protein [Armatimonadota bacterium]
MRRYQILWAMLIIWLSGLALSSAQQGGDYDNSWWSIDNGGVSFASGGVYETGATLGQWDASNELLGPPPYRNTGGFWAVPLLAPSNGDVDGDGCVHNADLLSVLFNFGQSGLGFFQDLNQDYVVNNTDLLIVLFNFGQGC